jgi:amino acid transporter
MVVGLRANTVGLVGLATLGAVMMSPALGIYGTWGPMASIVGLPTPLVFLGALVVSLPTAISYALVNREFPSAGSAFTWAWKTTSPTVGTWVGLMMTLYYTVAVILQPILFGLFFNSLLQFFGFSHTSLLTWGAGVLIVTLFVFYLTYRGIEMSTRSAVTCILIEMAVVVALSITIAVTTGVHHQFSFAPLNPAQIQGGGSAFWAAMILGLLSFTGYDVISTVAEEAHAPRRLLPVATLIATLGVGVFWALNSWMFSIAVPVSQVQKLTASGLTPAVPIAQQYWGWGQLFVILTGMTAATAVYVATVVGASRALYAMARQRTLPAPLAKLNPRRQVPWNAMHVVYAVSLIGVIVVTAVLGNALDAFVWWAGPVVFFALITYMFVNLANIIYFARFSRQKFNWFLNGLIPVIGIGLDAYLIYKSFFQALWSAGFRSGQSIILLSMVLAVLGAGYVAYLKVSAPRRLAEPVTAFDES